MKNEIKRMRAHLVEIYKKLDSLLMENSEGTEKLIEAINKKPDIQKVEVDNLDEFPETKQQKLPTFPKSIKVNNLKEIKQPVVKVTQKEIKFPEVQKVHINNFPDEIENEGSVTIDRAGNPKLIREEFDKYILETSFEDTDDGRKWSIKRINK